MAHPGQAHSPVRAKTEVVLLHFQVTVASDALSLGADLEGVVSSLADSAEGKATITLADGWYALTGWANCQNAAGLHVANVTTTAPTTVVMTLAGLAEQALDDSVDLTVDVFLYARRKDV